jgi:hypothetical protein
VSAAGLSLAGGGSILGEGPALPCQALLVSEKASSDHGSGACVAIEKFAPDLTVYRSADSRDQFYTLLDAEASRTGNQGDLVKHVEERCDFCNCRRLIGSTCSTRLRHRKPGSLASRRLKRKAASAGGKPVRFKNELVSPMRSPIVLMLYQSF